MKPVKFVKPKSLEKWNAAKDTRQMDLFDNPPSLYTAEFLEKRVVEWQTEARKQAHQISELQDALAKAYETRNVTSEVTEVMKEVMDLRATVAYLESKLFGGK